eukprot:c33860_g1_i1 orf=89-247(+)
MCKFLVYWLDSRVLSMEFVFLIFYFMHSHRKCRKQGQETGNAFQMTKTFEMS